MADNLFDGRKLRMHTIVDLYTRECLAIDVGQSLKGDDVVRVLGNIAVYRGLPRTVKTDKGSEFISTAMEKRATASNCTSADQAIRLTTPSWRASTGGCARSA